MSIRITYELYEKGVISEEELQTFLQTVNVFRDNKIDFETHGVFNNLLSSIITSANIYDRDIFQLLIENEMASAGSAYMNWDTAVHFHIESAEFVTLKDLMIVLRHARRINFSVKSRREETRQMISDIVRFEINERSRAPRNPFVNLTNSVFADLLDNIVSALDFGDRTLDHEEKSTSANRYSSINDAKLTYARSISHMTEIESKNLSHLQPFGVFVRETFEQNYELIWGAAAESDSHLDQDAS